jgi:hypothetical protein
MATTMGARAAEFLLSEAPGTLSREEIVIASGESLVSGTVLGKLTSGGKYAAYNDALSDGTETAVGILLYDADATDADQNAVMIARLAEVESAHLTGSDANGLADLAALNIIARA